MEIVRTISDMRSLVRGWRSEGLRIGFVPTMGYLHRGHLSLIEAAARDTDRIVVSIYVNPTQFGPDEDLDRYPRDFERDEKLCREQGAHAVFYPDNRTMYEPDHSTWVEETALTAPLCGRSRPGHFRGVTTVVTKLFNIVTPDVAVFGRKDAQQALVICRMVRDLNMDIDIVVAPIVREPDGLAMSSRNKYLSPDWRKRALSISAALADAETAFRGGERCAPSLCAAVRERIEAAGGRVDYVDLVSRLTLEAAERAEPPALLAVAAVFGNTRLIDNVFLD